MPVISLAIAEDSDPNLKIRMVSEGDKEIKSMIPT